MLIIALARSAWSLSNTGSPIPVGTFNITPVITPPTVSPCFLIESIYEIISEAIASSGQRTIVSSVFEKSISL